MVNRQLFKDIASQIAKTPERYNQYTWCEANECKTVACIAGWVMQLNGWEPLFNKFGDIVVWQTEARNTLGRSYTKRIDAINTLKEARKLLDISKTDAENLFGHNWAPKQGLTVPEALKRIANGASVREVSLDYNENPQW